MKLPPGFSFAYIDNKLVIKYINNNKNEYFNLRSNDLCDNCQYIDELYNDIQQLSKIILPIGYEVKCHWVKDVKYFLFIRNKRDKGFNSMEELASYIDNMEKSHSSQLLTKLNLGENIDENLLKGVMVE